MVIPHGLPGLRSGQIQNLLPRFKADVVAGQRKILFIRIKPFHLGNGNGLAAVVNLEKADLAIFLGKYSPPIGFEMTGRAFRLAMPEEPIGKRFFESSQISTVFFRKK